MEEQIISLETAKLAKDKGFNQNPYRTLRCYAPEYTDGSNVRLIASLYCPEANVCVAPTQSLLQKWLRETHDIHLYVEPMDDNTFQSCLISDKLEEDSDDDVYGNTYEESLEEGLKEALNLI